MSADTNSAASSSMVPGSENNTTVSGGSAATNAQPTNAQSQRTQGSGYSAQAADIAGTDERPGADGGRGAPRHDSTDDEMSADDLRALVKSLRAEAAAGRKAKQELDARQRAEEDAKLSETEKLQKQLAEYQAQVEALNLQKQEIALRARVDTTATALGIKPELALRILDQSLVAYDDDGFPTNIRELLEQAMQDFGLAPSAPASSSSAGPNAAHPNNALAAAQQAQGRFAPPPPVPATGATNPPRQGGIAAANGVFGPNERPRLNDRRLWSGPRRG